MRNLELVPKASDALYGFMPGELNEQFSDITIFSTENPAEALNSISTA